MIKTPKARFVKNTGRHGGTDWSTVQERLRADPRKLEAIHEMERTGGEPDVIGDDQRTDTITYCDCSSESPKGRRSICYDVDALAMRKEHKPSGSAIEMAASMGIEMLARTFAA